MEILLQTIEKFEVVTIPGKGIYIHIKESVLYSRKGTARLFAQALKLGFKEVSRGKEGTYEVVTFKRK